MVSHHGGRALVLTLVVVLAGGPGLAAAGPAPAVDTVVVETASFASGQADDGEADAQGNVTVDNVSFDRIVFQNVTVRQLSVDTLVTEGEDLHNQTITNVTASNLVLENVTWENVTSSDAEAFANVTGHEAASGQGADVAANATGEAADGRVLVVQGLTIEELNVDTLVVQNLTRAEGMDEGETDAAGDAADVDANQTQMTSELTIETFAIGNMTVGCLCPGTTTAPADVGAADGAGEGEQTISTLEIERFNATNASTGSSGAQGLS